MDNPHCCVSFNIKTSLRRTVLVINQGSCLVDKKHLWDKIHSAIRNAEVAELADALRSGRSESNLMRVQVPPSAPECPERDSQKRGSFCLPAVKVIAMDFLRFVLKIRAIHG